jgi:DNA repair exonuclease SbcCD ATPase subunit
MIKVNGYYDKNLWQWHKLTEIFPDIKVHKLIDCYTTPAPLNEINKRLDEGHPVIVCVDFDPKAGVQTHYVVIFGREGDDYYIADPWYNDIVLFKSRYGDPAKAIYAIRMYDGPLIAPVSNETEQLRKELEELKIEYASLEATITEKNQAISQLTENEKKWQKEAKSANDNLGKVLEEKGELEKTIASLERKVEKLEKEFGDMEKEKNANWQLYKKALESQTDKQTSLQLVETLFNRLYTRMKFFFVKKSVDSPNTK